MDQQASIARTDSCSTSVRRRVLITDTDLFGSLGGGQTVLRRLIASHPGDQFYYFLCTEPEAARRPANAFGIPLVRKYEAVPESLPESERHLLWAYRDARNLAFSAARQWPGSGFDVVDVPDYTTHGIFIRAALEAEGLACDRVVLALHGTLSSALAAGWPAPGSWARELDEMRRREDLQFSAVDARYAISAFYAREWQRKIPLPINLLDPLGIVGEVDPQPCQPRDGAPDLAFVGRREKWKGPDLFLDFAWCVDPALYRRLIIAGPDGPNRLGLGSDEILASIARVRGLRPEIVGGLQPPAVRELLAERTVLLLPSRHDTFNLVGLEALARGCPALVSRNAGVAQWLLEHLPDLAAWLVVDVGCARTAAARVADVLTHYDARRTTLVEAMRRLKRPGPTACEEAYRPASMIDIEARQTVVELAGRFATLARVERRSRTREVLSRPMAPVRRLYSMTTQPLRPDARGRWPVAGLAVWGLANAVRTLRRGGLDWAARETLKHAAGRISGLSPRTLGQIARSRHFERIRQQMLAGPETDAPAQRRKLGELSLRVPDHLVDRVPLFREMARLERRVGHDLIAATYALRIMRWLGRDRFGDLPFASATLRKYGFDYEARAAEAMFGPAEGRDERCLEVMEDAVRRNRRQPEHQPLAELADRRGPVTPRVSVIVSVYNGADKLPTMLSSLAQQSVAARGELEVVLIDSHSPADERAALEGFLRRRDLPVVYARSCQRETIQQAWNRGIGLARAPYLAFLGVDEGLHPDALGELAAALDADPGADWAMADSVVTSVDGRGIYDADVMPYDRTGYRQDLVYLETCYLSWVGGLYRRSIHDRFGYYDESFTAAGDTEFKCRVLPQIRSVHVPRMLGVFNNYPEQRITHHPRAEIEDLRAWYLWRTTAGMRHAFDARPAEDAIALLRTALNYRKSFCGHLSSDFDLADALAQYLTTRADVSAEWAHQAVAATGATVASLRALEQLPRPVAPGPRGLGLARRVLGEVRAMHRRMAERHRVLFDLPGRPHYEVFNDNRYEQHWWSWSQS